MTKPFIKSSNWMLLQVNSKCSVLTVQLGVMNIKIENRGWACSYYTYTVHVLFGDMNCSCISEFKAFHLGILYDI